jgi:hypothetical protein
MTRYLKRAGSPTSDQPVEPLAPAAQTPAQPGAPAAPAPPAGGGAPAPGGPRQDPPAPVAEILGTIGAPILTVLLGAGLLYAINIDERCTTLSGSIMSVRQAIAASLDSDLTPEHLAEVLNAAAAKPSAEPKTPEEKKKADDAAVAVRRIADRLDKRRTVLTETLSARVMSAHPALALQHEPPDDKTPGPETGTNKGEDPCAGRSTATPTGDRKTPEPPTVERVVASRLSDRWICQAIQAWTPETMDPRTERAVATAGLSTATIATRIADMVDGRALRRSVLAVVAPQRSPFEPKGPESAWTKDVNARLMWAITALIFCLAFGLVLFTSIGPIVCVDPDDRKWVLIPLAGAIVIAVWLPAYQPSLQATPLHAALTSYAELFHVGILDYVRWFEAIRAIGIILLIAGSVATFVVACRKKPDLEQQLRRFKSLFNAGAVFLLAGVLEVYARYRWPLTFVTDTTAQASLQSTAAMVAATAGALYSVVLLVAYIATTFVLRQQAIEHGVDRTEVDQALSVAGFGDFPAQQLMRFAQSLVPLLPGVLTLFVSGIQ